MRPTFTSFESMAASTRLLEQIVQSMIEGCSALFGVPASTLQSMVEEYEPKPPTPDEPMTQFEDPDCATEASTTGYEEASCTEKDAETAPAASAGTALYHQSSAASWMSGDDAGVAEIYHDGATTPRLLSPASTTTITDGFSPSETQSQHDPFTAVGIVHSPPPTQPPPPPPVAKVSPAFTASPTPKLSTLPQPPSTSQQQQRQHKSQHSSHSKPASTPAQITRGSTRL